MSKALILGAVEGLLLLCITVSCSRASPPLPASQEGEIPQRGPDIDHPPALSRSIKAQEPPLPHSTNQQDLAIPLPSGGGLYPEDFYIGSLARSPEELHDAEDAARSWLRAYLGGGAEENYQSIAFSRPFTDFRDRLGETGFNSFRLASGIALDKNSVSFLVRLRGPTHNANAELVVARIDDKWLVDDIILDDEPLERGEERRFDPFTYTRFL